MRKHKRVTGFSLHDIKQVAVYSRNIPKQSAMQAMMADFNKHRACLITEENALKPYTQRRLNTCIGFTCSKKAMKLLREHGVTVFEYERLGKNSFLLTS